MRDADDGEGDLVDEDGLADDVGIAIEAPAPLLVRDGRNGRCAWPVVRVGQRPAGRRADAESTKVVARHVLAGGHVGAAVDDDIELLERIEGKQLGQGAIGLDLDGRGVQIDWSENAGAETFARNEIVARCEMRAACSVFRPGAIVKGDLTA